jgi:hypothetical protein
MTNRELARVAYEALELAVRIKWFDPMARARVQHWGPTLVDAYEAELDGDVRREVTLPESVLDPRTDSAAEVLGAFDSWLGRGIVFRSLNLARELDDRNEPATPVSLATGLGL